ncbi:AAA family ATPase [Isoptericola sp. F-RaC21]|uniref:AAA family ATPase n=1 Tax=Isoptericola sp. F-RaC21 TaxID=3141452 RepID=UPI00315B8F37
MTTWGVHNDRPEIDPIADGAVRIGWDEVGDLTLIEPSRDAFKAAVAARMPEVGEPQIPSAAGTLYRFVHELHDGDVVVCPNRKTSTLDIGTVTGAYQHHPESAVHQHWRPVSWVRTGVPRTELSTAAQNELGSATTLFTIRTGADEIGHLMSAPAHDDEPDFAWTRFYAPLVDALLTYRDDRTTLLEKLWNAAQASGRQELFKYLRSDHYVDGTRGPIRDVDPFTILGTFNRGIRPEARSDIARALGDEFGVQAPSPTTFPGVPLVNNLASWFFLPEDERDEHAIPALWELCVAATEYAAAATEHSRERLVSAFDACATGSTRKLTMGIFWSRPESFGAYDSLNTSLLKQEFPELAARLSLGSRIDGESFLANTEAFAAWLVEPGTPFSTFAEFSNAAFEAASVPPGNAETSTPGETEAVEQPSAPSTTTGESYGIDSIREDGGFVTASDLETMLERLRTKKNIILQGPPGTGKTWLARRLAWALCDERGSTRVQVVQFHPSLSYEDFVRGWRPSATGLELADGPFLDMCGQAALDPEHPYVLVIEEINRGNPAQIFGELLTLMEADKRSPDYAMRLAYPRGDEQFFVPPNLHVVGTMNVADRSLAIVDMALRRRFAFVDLAPSFGEDWVEHVSGLGYDRDLLEVYGARVLKLNDSIAADNALGRQYAVGHSYFTPATRLDETGLTTQEWWSRVVKTAVQPLLEEYWFDRPDLAASGVTQLLGG